MSVEDDCTMPRTAWDDQVDAWVSRVIRLQRHLVDQVCEIALADGRYGVLVDAAGVHIDKGVPAGEIHYAAQGPSALNFCADFRVPE